MSSARWKRREGQTGSVPAADLPAGQFAGRYGRIAANLLSWLPAVRRSEWLPQSSHRIPIPAPVTKGSGPGSVLGRPPVLWHPAAPPGYWYFGRLQTGPKQAASVEAEIPDSFLLFDLWDLSSGHFHRR